MKIYNFYLYINRAKPKLFEILDSRNIIIIIIFTFKSEFQSKLNIVIDIYLNFGKNIYL